MHAGCLAGRHGVAEPPTDYSPVNPGKQLQSKLPWVLTQAALLTQLLVPRTHSLISMLHFGPSYLTHRKTD
jgi:hypothetical protein